MRPGQPPGGPSVESTPVPGDDERTVEAGGREVRISRPDKVYFPALGATKFDLVSYYLEVGDHLLNTAGGRPAMLQRFPDGATGKSFYQKRIPAGAPEWLQSTTVSTPNGTTSNALVVADIAHVVWAVNIGCLGLHLWPYLAADPAHADELRIDLDPTTGIGFDEVRAVALLCRDVLEELGLRGYPKTTGNNGLHVYLRLAGALGLGAGAGRCGGAGPRARAPLPGPDHGELVEGGARQPRLRRLQPERAPQDRLRRLVRPAPHGRAGLDARSPGRRSRRWCPTI